MGHEDITSCGRVNKIKCLAQVTAGWGTPISRFFVLDQEERGAARLQFGQNKDPIQI
jgi:hypothetical protein